MATSATIPVRLPAELVDALDFWAKSIGQSRSAAIKLCLAKQLGLVEKADAAALSALDGRHYRYVEIPPPDSPARVAAREAVKRRVDQSGRPGRRTSKISAA